MRAFYNDKGEIMGYVESDYEDGFSIEGMTAQTVSLDDINMVKKTMADKKNLKGPKDIKPPKLAKDEPTDRPTLTPHPKV